MFLITGFGASGTMYTAEVFQKLGYDVGHEKDGKDGVVSWKHLPRYKEYDKVLHQVRNPLKVLGSAVTGRPKNIDYILSHFDINIEFKDKFHKVMLAYFMWNEWAESVSQRGFRIEKFDETYPQVFRDELGLEIPEKLPSVSKLTNTHKYRDTYMEVFIDDLYERDEDLTRDILDMALRYGYDL